MYNNIKKILVNIINSNNWNLLSFIKINSEILNIYNTKKNKIYFSRHTNNYYY